MAPVLNRINDRIQLVPQQVYGATENLWLVLREDKLLSPATGKQCHFDPGFASLGEDGAVDQLVAAVRQLAEGDDRPVCLLLPLSYFLYTHYSIQLGEEYLNDRKMVHSAINFQKDILLPAIDRDFVLAAAPGRAAGVSFWFPQAQLKAIESAADEAGIDLIGIAPRILAAVPESPVMSATVITDTDASHTSIVEVQDGVITQVLSASLKDLENEELLAAWNTRTAPLLDGVPTKMTDAEDWLRLKPAQSVLGELMFFTGTFLSSVARQNRRKRITAGVSAAIAAIMLMSVPFLYQWIDSIRIESSLEEYRSEASMAEAFQEEILDMEYEWGVVYEYPEADTAGILLALNSVINNALTSFSLSDSIVEIQGSVQDPELLIRSLVEQPLFRNIEQSRSISDSRSGSGDRFGLRITLSGPDYEEYLEKYEFK